MSLPPSAPDDLALVAALVAIEPHAIGGVVVKARPGPTRDAFLSGLRALWPPDTAWRKLPCHIAEDRLIGGLDLAATLSTGRPVVSRGVLAEADGGIVVVAMAERLEPGRAATLSRALDTGEIVLERDGLALRLPARIGIVALDESEEDERLVPGLADRLALEVRLDGVRPSQVVFPGDLAARIARARARPPKAKVSRRLTEALCKAAVVLGIASLQAVVLAVAITRASAALAGRTRATDADAETAARLVFAHRARAGAEMPDQQAAPDLPTDAAEQDETDRPEDDAALTDVLVAAVASALPNGVLPSAESGARTAGSRGRSGAERAARFGGRCIGVRAAAPRSGERLALIPTLRAAAPWQRLRRRGRDASVEVRGEDLRVERRLRRSRSLTVFAVDASGSSAFGRLAEAKGAVELLLAQSYARRDEVALLAFRGTSAELLLPPTRSLTRAKRCLGALVGGGGTPLAAGLDAAAALAQAALRRGDTPTLVVLTDGHANIARDGTVARAQAADEAAAAAGRLAALGVTAVLVDTSARPRPAAERLAHRMGARYLALPHADARTLSRALDPRHGASAGKPGRGDLPRGDVRSV
jgi:magnesium chelatase subunit D